MCTSFILNRDLDTKAIAGHTHDERYYTESEVNNLLNNKFKNCVGNDTGHNIKMAYENITNISSPTIIIDGNSFYPIMFDGCNGHSAKLLKTELDINTNPWTLKFVFRIDGKNYTEIIKFDS